MPTERIARILYNMALDMDYADGIEEAEDEIKYITAELQTMRTEKLDSLFNVLENIALKNENMEFWKEGVCGEKI